jgi:CRP/FNR family transcriptional regulator, dissimilatory nitrate respiration regulator
MFSEVDDNQLDNLFDIARIEQFSKGDFLFHEQDTFRGFYVLLEGSVKVFIITSDAKEVIIHLVKPFQSFAEIPLFEGKNYPVSAQALENSTLLLFPKSEFIELLKNNYQISLKILAGFAKRLRDLTSKIESLSSKEVITRFAKYLLEETTLAGNINLPEPYVRFTVNRSTIAGYLGTITETLSRTLKKLQEDKIIRVSGRKIFISDLKRLKELSK